MAIVQISKIQHRTGANIDLPQLDIGEIGFATDDRRLYIGNDPVIHPAANSSTTTQTEILTEVSNLDFGKITGTSNGNINLANVAPGQLVVARNIANSTNLEWVNAGGNAKQPGNTSKYNNVNVHLGHADYVKLGGGTNGYVLQTDGTGNLTWAAFLTGSVVAGTPGGSNGQIQFNDGGTTFGGSSDFVYNAANSYYALTGNLSVITGSITGNTIGPHTGTIGATTPNTGAFTSITVSNNATITGNITGGNANISGRIAVTGNANVGNLFSTGLANVGNLRVTSRVQSNLVPSSDETFDLGSSSLKWRDLYLSGTTIKLGTQNISSNTNGISITGNLYLSTNTVNVASVTANTLGGTLTTSAQPNITSLGNLSTLAVDGISYLGNAANVRIAGGVNGYVLTTNGLGGLSWEPATATTTSPGGSNNFIQFNDSGSFGGAPALTYDPVNFIVNAPNLTVNGEFQANVSNLRIQGGVSGQFLKTNGSGGLSWATAGGGGSAAGANGEIQYSSNGSFAASSALTFTPSSNTLTVANISGTITTAAQPNITSVGTLSNLTVTGNIAGGNANLGNAVRANFFIGSGANLTNINGANVGQVANANYSANAGNANSATVANTIIDNAQPNITSVGTLTALTVTGNSSFGNIGNVRITGGANGQFIKTDGAGNLSWVAGQSPDSNANSIQYNSNGNFTGTSAFTFNGSTNTLSVTYITGTLSANSNSQPNITSVGNLTNVTVTGTITSGNANLGNAVRGNFFIGSGNNLSNIQAGNISGAIANANVAGTVSVNAQPNITSVGTLNTLSITNTLDVTGNANIGNINSVDEIHANYLYGDGANITNIDGNAISSDVANANYSAYAGYVTNPQQSNITLLGNLSSLRISGTTNVNSVDALHLEGAVTNMFLSTDPTGFSILDRPGHSGSGLLVFDALVGLTPLQGAGLGVPQLANTSNTDAIVIAKNDSTAPDSHSFIPVSDLTTNLGDSNDEAIGEVFFRNAYLASAVIKDTSDANSSNWPAAMSWQIIAGSAGLYITDGTGVYPIQVGPDEAGNFGVPSPIPR
jgi:hypothetical protein